MLYYDLDRFDHIIPILIEYQVFLQNSVEDSMKQFQLGTSDRFAHVLD